MLLAVVIVLMVAAFIGGHILGSRQELAQQEHLLPTITYRDPSPMPVEMRISRENGCKVCGAMELDRFLELYGGNPPDIVARSAREAEDRAFDPDLYLEPETPGPTQGTQ